MTDMTANRRHLYTVVRVVPNPAAGEFINYAIIVTDPDTGAYAIRRAATNTHALRLANQIHIDAVNEHLNRLTKNRRTLTEADLNQLRHDHRNVIQYSQPLPIIGINPQNALDFIFNHLIIEE